MAGENAPLADFTRHVGGWTQEQRARVLRARPDVTPDAAAGGARALAVQLASPAIQGALGTTLPLGPTEVLVAALLVGDATRERLAGLLGTDPQTLAPSLEALLERALLWDDGGLVRPAPGLRRTLQPPVQLGPIAEEAVERLTGSQADTALRRLGQRAPSPTKRATSLDALRAALADEAVVRAAAESAPAPVRRTLQGRFAQAQGTRNPLTAMTTAALTADHQALRWAEQKGLAFHGPGYGGYQTYATSPYDIYFAGPQLPREVVVALRPPDAVLTFTPHRPPVATHPVATQAVAQLSTTVLAELTATTTALLDEIDRSPLPLLRSGGVGVREVRRLAKLTGTEEAAVRFALDLAGLRGLLADEHGLDILEAAVTGAMSDQTHVSSQGRAWRDRQPAGRAAALATAWLTASGHLTHPAHNGRHRPALLPVEACSWCVASRAGLLAALSQLDAGEATSRAEVAAAAHWEAPAAHPGSDASQVPFGLAWAEAERTGIIAAGALSPLGRLLLARDVAGAEALLAEAMAPSVDTVLFGADLTAIVPGDPSASVSRLLDSCADREGRGGAVVWRLSAGSVRRALDTGVGGEALLERLGSVADGRQLPQPLAYLVRDVARSHGLVRVRPAVSVLRCPDEPLLAQVCADRALGRLGLQRVATTVATTTVPPQEVLAALRAAGYLPMPEAHGAVVDLPGTPGVSTPSPGPTAPVAPKAPRKPAPKPAAATKAAAEGPRWQQLTDEERVHRDAPQLSAEGRRLLVAALTGGGPLVIEYVTVAGTRSTRRLEALRLLDAASQKASLTAFYPAEGEQRTFRLDRIVAVSAADPTDPTDPA